MTGTAIEVDEKIKKALDTAPDEDDIVLEVKPPKESDGLAESIELLRSFHQYEQEGFLFKKNTSKTCGLEIWYEDDALRFMYYVPDEEEEQHYRRQLSGHYKGVDIERRENRENKFITVSEGEHIAVTEFALNRHYFEPIRSPESDTDRMEQDPYQTLLSEMATSEDTKTVFQVMYKPAPSNWTELNHDNVESHAEKMQNSGGVKTRWFGLIVDEVDTPSYIDASANQVRQQLQKHAFYVNVRLIVVDKDKNRAKNHMNTLTNLIEKLYREPTGQYLVPKSYNKERDIKNLLVDTATRNERYMSQPTFGNPLKYLKFKLKGVSETMIMTIPEVGGLAHLPSGSDVDVPSISWTDVPVEGSLPPEKEKFSPVSEDERSRLLGEEGKSSDTDSERWESVDRTIDEDEEEDVWGEESINERWLPDDDADESSDKNQSEQTTS